MKFLDVNGQDTIIFKPDENGQMEMVQGYPFMTFKRIGLWQNAKVLASRFRHFTWNYAVNPYFMDRFVVRQKTLRA